MVTGHEVGGSSVRVHSGTELGSGLKAFALPHWQELWMMLIELMALDVQRQKRNDMSYDAHRSLLSSVKQQQRIRNNDGRVAELLQKFVSPQRRHTDEHKELQDRVMIKDETADAA